MKRLIKEYFNYSKTEIRGILVLIVLIIVVFSWPIFSQHFNSESKTNFDLFKNQLAQFETNVQVEDKELYEESISYFTFDPNTVKYTELLRLGLLNKQAQTLINYRNAGGVFVEPNDLKKIYTINDVLYNKLKPFIKIETNKESVSVITLAQNKKKENPNINLSIEKKKFELIELNLADTIDLIKLYGIGPTLAKRIVNYRALLGGYFKNNQLLEVYGLSSETYSTINNKINVDAAIIQKININSASFKKINSHPYITYSDTKAILKYRELMGSFLSIQVLIENHLIDSITYNKVKNYIEVD